jgi:predicted O-methyltransferase YrrM
MSQELWTAVDDYFADLFITPDPILDAALRDSATAGLPAIHVAPNQGKFLQVLALAIGARTILEIGTLGGYSTIWLARALPEGGKLISLEASPVHAEVARTNLTRAGLDRQVDVRLGPALETLSRLADDQAGPFDLVFIDADKVNTAAYFEWARKLTRVGSLIVTDNVVRRGQVIEAASDDENVQGIRRFNDTLAADPGASAAVIQTVGSKGYDGLVISVVTAGAE